MLVFTLGRLPDHVIFDADVDAQGGAYATGVLVLITSAAVAVTLAARRARQRRLDRRLRRDRGCLRLHHGRQRHRAARRREDRRLLHRRDPRGLAALPARPRLRAARHRASTSTRWPSCSSATCAAATIRFIANEPDARDRAEYRDKIRQISRDNDLPDDQDVIFVEVTVTDPSDFASRLDVCGEVQHGRYRVLTLSSSAVPNALAACC